MRVIGPTAGFYLWLLLWETEKRDERRQDETHTVLPSLHSAMRLFYSGPHFHPSSDSDFNKQKYFPVGSNSEVESSTPSNVSCSCPMSYVASVKECRVCVCQCVADGLRS